MRATALVLLGLLAAGQAHADDLATPDVYVIQRPDTYAAATCDFLASGPSANPSATPYHLVGYAFVESRRTAVSTSLRCRLRLRDAAGHPQVGQTLAQAAPGSTTSVVGDVLVGTTAPLEICTWFDATFADTTRLNPSGAEQCRTLTNTVDYGVVVSPGEILRKVISPPPPPPPD